MSEPYGCFNVWDGDTYLTVHWRLMLSEGSLPWVEWSVCEPQQGPNETDDQALVEGVTFPQSYEMRTIGSFDRDPHLLARAVDLVNLRARKELRGWSRKQA